MARRYPVRTQTWQGGGWDERGDTRTGSIFVGWRRRWRDKKPAASTLLLVVPLPLSLFLPAVSRFFSFVGPSYPDPQHRSFHSVRLFFCCHVASAAAPSSRRVYRLSYSVTRIVSPLSPSLCRPSSLLPGKLAASVPLSPPLCRARPSDGRSNRARERRGRVARTRTSIVRKR